MADTLARPPVGFDRILAKRAVLCALGPLAGLRAEGTVTMTATGDDVEVPPFLYGVPVIGGRALYSKMVKVLPSGRDARTNEPQGHTVTSAGTSLPVRAVVGGAGGNLPEGTPVIWQPLPAGIVARGSVDAGGIIGGLATPGPGRCADIVILDTLGRDNLKDLWSSQGGANLPAILIGRNGSTREHAVTIASALRRHTMQVFVASSNYAGAEERAEEAELLLDAIESTLEGLEDVEGEVFSGMPCEVGAEVRERPPGPNLHLWSVEISVHYALQRIDVRLTDGFSWQPWATTRIEIGEPEAPPLPQVDLVDVTADQT